MRSEPMLKVVIASYLHTSWDITGQYNFTNLGTLLKNLTDVKWFRVTNWYAMNYLLVTWSDKPCGVYKTGTASIGSVCLHCAIKDMLMPKVEGIRK